MDVDHHYKMFQPSIGIKMKNFPSIVELMHGQSTVLKA